MFANAHLLGAALNLFKALEALANEAFMHMTGGRQDLIDDAFAALAEARGEK